MSWQSFWYSSCTFAVHMATILVQMYHNPCILQESLSRHGMPYHICVAATEKRQITSWRAEPLITSYSGKWHSRAVVLLLPSHTMQAP